MTKNWLTKRVRTFDINHEDGDLPNRYNNIQELADEEDVGVGVELVVDKLEEVGKQLFFFLRGLLNILIYGF